MTMISESKMRQIAQAVDLLKAISNPKRLAILCRLLEGEMSVNLLSDAVSLSQSALSQHLAKLRSNGLVTTRREQQTIYYSIESKEAEAIIGVLEKLYCSKDVDSCG